MCSYGSSEFFLYPSYRWDFNLAILSHWKFSNVEKPACIDVFQHVLHGLGRWKLEVADTRWDGQVTKKPTIQHGNGKSTIYRRHMKLLSKNMSRFIKRSVCGDLSMCIHVLNDRRAILSFFFKATQEAFCSFSSRSLLVSIRDQNLASLHSAPTQYWHILAPSLCK